jgi:acetyltransferase-like isoleucine patch superfamily enzyme
VLESVTRQLKLWQCARVGDGVRVLGRVWAHGVGHIELGDGVVLDGRAAPVELRAGREGRLIIGDGCTVLGGASLEAEGTITLHKRVHVGPWVKIIDTHFHSLSGNRLERPPPGSVIVEDDCLLEAFSILLPGTHLEPGVVVVERAVVSRRVPARHRAKGNPARVEPPSPPAAASAGSRPRS